MIPQNFYMPAEWSPHQGCWMAWPDRKKTWIYGLEKPREAFVKVAQAIAEFEPVYLLVNLRNMGVALEYCQHPNIHLIEIPVSDIWLRDTGATFVINRAGGIAGIDWQFNAWGENREALSDYQADVELASNILNHLGMTSYHAPFVLEGGAIHVDGEGTLLTTEACLLNPNRNPQLNQTDIETYLKQYLGVNKIIWLGKGLDGDETAGHIDNIACFVRSGVVAALTCHDPQDSNYEILQDNLQRLRQATDAQGRKLEIIEIEQPSRRDDKEWRLALSYINFYIANGGIIVPTFDDSKRDNVALNQIQQAFPNHKVVPVEGLDLIYGGGCVHCMTQQQPRGVDEL
jgi:agmatine deiminase